MYSSTRVRRDERGSQRVLCSHTHTHRHMAQSRNDGTSTETVQCFPIGNHIHFSPHTPHTTFWSLIHSSRGSVLFWTPPHDISTRSHHLPIFFVTSAATSSIDSALSFVKGLGMSYKPANIHTSHETSIPFHEVTCHLSYIVLAACC